MKFVWIISRMIEENKQTHCVHSGRLINSPIPLSHKYKSRGVELKATELLVHEKYIFL